MAATASLKRGDWDGFFAEHVADDVAWTITGTNVLAGHYASKKAFVEGPIARLMRSLRGGITLEILAAYADGDVGILEMRSEAMTVAGHPYRNEYAWFLRFREGKVIAARVYYDDVLVNASMEP